MAQVPIAATEPGVERIRNMVNQKRVPQPRIPLQALADNPSRRDFFIAALAAAGIATHLVLRYGFRTSSLAQFIPLYFTLILGGLPLTFQLLHKVFAREFGSGFLSKSFVMEIESHI